MLRRALAAALATSFALTFAPPFAPSFAAWAQQPRSGRLVADTVHSTAIAKNKYGDSPDREVFVYLPPSYDANAGARFPVVYLLHGYGGTERSWIRGYGGFSIQPAMDSLIAAGAAREMIVVMPDAHNRLGGSFYTNSASGGNWEDFITKELVSYVDGKYRTIAKPESRGLAGHSMGGFGSFYLGMRHGGELYGAVYALSGCCTQFAARVSPAATAIWRQLTELTSLNEFRALTFYPQVELALSSAFSPDTAKAPLYVDFPFRESGGSWTVDEAIAAKWAEHSPYEMLGNDPRYAGNLKRLRGLAFDVGTHDQLVAPAQLFALDSALTRAGVAHSFET
ncbi:MAG TPA: alpha/beta fold hydrolase, partial [Casimicrobiaceae bacterium]